MTKPAPRTFHVKNYGCQMNAYDGARMADLLGAEGLAEAGAGDADLVVLNTCHIRERAAEKTYSDVGRLRRADGTSPLIAVAGCVAQAEGPEVIRRARAVDIVVGPQDYHNLPRLVADAVAGRSATATELPGLAKFGALPARRRAGASAFLTVQEGCDKFCTYCVVPYTRGAEISRSWEAILDEARQLVDAGAAEITLLGQNVNAWAGRDEAGAEQDLGGLIRALDRLPGVRRIRYTTSHPNDMTDGLIAAHRDVETLMPFLHLPVQSGSDRVLKAMNRRHGIDTYRRALDRVRAARPDIAISSDFIVGFPGETEAEFEATVALVREIGFASAYSFKYSARPGTPAATMDGALDPEVLGERLQRLNAAIAAGAVAFNAGCVGRRTDILIDRRGRRAGQVIGKSPWLQSVVVEGAYAMGSFVDVVLTEAGPNSMHGVVASGTPAKAGVQGTADPLVPPAEERTGLHEVPWTPAFAGVRQAA